MYPIKKKNRKTFHFWYKVHLYGGLLSAAFFLLIGITALSYNHPEWFAKKNVREKSYSRSFHYRHDDLQALMNAATDSLAIFGHRPYWLQWHDDQGNFHFQINRPGREYRIVADRKKNLLHVNEKFTGIIQTMAGMHVSSAGFPATKVFSAWKVFAHVFVLYGLLSVIQGVWFWKIKSKLSLAQWITAGFIFTGSVVFIFYIWLVG